MKLDFWDYILMFIVGAFVLYVMLVLVPMVYADEIEDLAPHIIQIESGGNRFAYNMKSKAMGLFQITPIVLLEYNRETGVNRPAEHLFDYWINYEIGMWYLYRLKNHYLKNKYTPERLLAAFNGGITRLRKNNYDINKMPEETREYVRKVMRLYQESKND